MQRRWRYYVSSVAAQINAGRESNLVADKPSRVREVEVAATTTRTTLYRRGQAIVLLLETFQARIATVPGINIEDDEAGNTTGDDTNAGLGPTGEPGVAPRPP